MDETPSAPDLAGEVSVGPELFDLWLRDGSRSPQTHPCAAALMRYALDEQGSEMRGSVDGGTVWELCGRLLEQPAEVVSTCSTQAKHLAVSRALRALCGTDLIKEPSHASGARQGQGCLESLPSASTKITPPPLRVPFVLLHHPVPERLPRA